MDERHVGQEVLGDVRLVALVQFEQRQGVFQNADRIGTQARLYVRADGLRRRHLGIDRAREREGINVRTQRPVHHAGRQAEQFVEAPHQNAFRRRIQARAGVVGMRTLLMR